MGVCYALQAEALFQQFKAKKEVLQGKSKEQVMAKYGSAAKPPDEEVLALAQSENYVEYNAQVCTVRFRLETASVLQRILYQDLSPCKTHNICVRYMNIEGDVGAHAAGPGDQGRGRHPALALPGRCPHQQPQIGAPAATVLTKISRL